MNILKASTRTEEIYAFLQNGRGLEYCQAVKLA